MKAQICPYLGQLDDRDTALHFPADANACLHANPVQVIRREHQKNFCLTGQHAACPVFQRAALTPLPEEIAAPAGGKLPLTPGRLTALSGMLVAVMLALLVLNGMTSAAVRPVERSLAGLIPFTGAGFFDAFNRPDADAEPALAFATGSPPAPAADRAACAPPAGWQPYTVQPTDTLLMLGRQAGLAAGELQRANCLDSPVIFPGEVIYLPPLPTASPTLVPTRTLPPFYGYVLPAQPADDDEDEDDEPEQSAQPTARPTARPTGTNAPASPPPAVVTNAPRGGDDDRDDDKAKDDDKDEDKSRDNDEDDKDKGDKDDKDKDDKDDKDKDNKGKDKDRDDDDRDDDDDRADDDD